jgi:hypothetical protein
VVTGLAELDVPLLVDEPAELGFAAWLLLALLLVECAARAGSCPEIS